MKKLVLRWLFVMACISPLSVWATNETYDVWDGTTSAVTATGDTYTITTAAELAWFATQDDDYSGMTIALNANIDLNGKKWTPIGTATKPFKGTFNGNGHLLKGLRALEGTDGVGLFGHVDATGVIENVGISGGTIVAKNKRRVGALAGVLAGKINNCWSMAYIATAGNVVGGLVGELTATGTITDSYQTGFINNASDTIGALVGLNNGGTLTRTYNAGYAKNGKAIVGMDKGGTYKETYYDRKLYYQESGITDDQQSQLDVTSDLFEVFASNATWATDTKRYPILTTFANTDAALLSAAPILLNVQTAIAPIDHANDLIHDFNVPVDGITWTCQDKSDETWIAFDNTLGNATVVRPCTETDILVDSKKGNETRVVYFRPRRVEDLMAGIFTGCSTDRTQLNVIHGYCFESYETFHEEAFVTAAKNGWTSGEYFYQVIRYAITETDTITVDTLVNNYKNTDYLYWVDTAKVPTNVAGHYIIRSYVHDEGCVQDWIENPTGFEYYVYGEFIPGLIESGRDTLFLTTSPINVTVNSQSLSVGGAGPITYWWNVSVNGGAYTVIEGATAPTLTNYPITSTGVYRFTRGSKDTLCYTDPDHLDALGLRTVYVFDSFDAGTITGNLYQTFCTPADAYAFTTTTTPATGGAGNTYHYQWYTVDGTDTTAIAGATQQNLNLSLLTLVPNGTYIFVRKAEDNTRFTNLTLSQNTLIVHIQQPVEAGAIFDGALDNYCAPYNATGSETVTVSITETTAATGDVSLEYHWYRVYGTDSVEVGNNASLNYTLHLSDIVLGRTYTYVRTVNNTGCEEVLSSGQATQYYGISSQQNVTVTVCESEMPYTLTVGEQSHRFTSTTEKWTVTDNSGECPDVTIYSLNVVTAPAFQVSDVVSWCKTNSTMAIYFEQTEGLSDVFHISYSPDLAAQMGVSDTTGIITTPGTIVFENVPALSTIDANGRTLVLKLYLQIGYKADSDEGICFSAAREMTLYPSLGGYVYSKYDRVVFVDNNPDNGALSDVTEKLEFVEYQWYKNGLLQPGQTGQYYHEGGVQLNGVFYCQLTDTKGNIYRTCDITLPAEGASAAPQMTSIYPVPVNAGETLTIEGFGTAQVFSFSGNSVATVEHLDGKTTLAAPTVPGIYYVQITSAEGTPEIHKLIVK